MMRIKKKRSFRKIFTTEIMKIYRHATHKELSVLDINFGHLIRLTPLNSVILHITLWHTVSKTLWSKWKSLLQIPMSVHFHITNMKSISQKCRDFREHCIFTNVITAFQSTMSIFYKMTFKLMPLHLIHLTNMISIFEKVDDIFQTWISFIKC